MLSILKKLYFYFLYKQYSNTEVKINCDSMIFLSGKTYFNGPLCTDAKLVRSKSEIAEEDIKPRSTKEEEIKPGSIKEIVFIGEKANFEFYPGVGILYVFCLDGVFGNVFYDNKDVFFNPRILKVGLNKPLYNFLLAAIEVSPNNKYITIRSLGSFWQRMVTPLICIGMFCVMLKFGRSITKKLSKLDPIYTDFTIVSSLVKKFKDLTSQTMAQCSICFEDFVEEEEIRILDCGHYYHPKCIDRWLIGHTKRCPCCRGKIEINEKV
ncbi:hypothetical protein GINT2_000699 [Glugoides intestinalis]